MPPEVATLIHRHVETDCDNPNCVYLRRARQHNAAVFALVALRLAAETYYEAAGFRQ